MFEEIFFQALFVQTKLLFWKGKLYIRVCVCVCVRVYIKSFNVNTIREISYNLRTKLLIN